MTTFLLRPPTVRVPPAGGRRPFLRIGLDVGVSLLVDELGAVIEKQHPSDVDCEQAAHVLLGGHEYEVDEAMAAVLTAAGYGGRLEAVA